MADAKAKEAIASKAQDSLEGMTGREEAKLAETLLFGAQE